MKSGYRTIEEIEAGLPYPVVALGFFDGVHLGHQSILELVKQRAGIHAGTSIALTLDQHPASVIRERRPPKLLTTLPERISLLLGAGLDRVVTVRFTPQFAAMPPEQFVEEILVGRLGVREVIAGHDYRFGRFGAGDMGLLRRLGEVKGFSVTEIPPVQAGGGRVSSTAIRGLLQAGKVEAAAALLSRYYNLSGLVVPGEQRGRKLGFPTANLSIDAEKVVPGAGVYAVKVRCAQQVPGVTGVQGDDSLSWYPGVLSVSNKPTFDGSEQTVEVHLLDFHGDLYQRYLYVEFVQFLRPIFRYGAVEELVAQVRQDMEATKKIFGPTR